MFHWSLYSGSGWTLMWRDCKCCWFNPTLHCKLSTLKCTTPGSVLLMLVNLIYNKYLYTFYQHKFSYVNINIKRKYKYIYKYASVIIIFLYFTFKFFENIYDSFQNYILSFYKKYHNNNFFIDFLLHSNLFVKHFLLDFLC